MTKICLPFSLNAHCLLIITCKIVFQVYVKIVSMSYLSLIPLSYIWMILFNFLSIPLSVYIPFSSIFCALFPIVLPVSLLTLVMLVLSDRLHSQSFCTNRKISYAEWATSSIREARGITHIRNNINLHSLYSDFNIEEIVHSSHGILLRIKANRLYISRSFHFSFVYWSQTVTKSTF